jgi:hypothetical protein
MGVERPWKRQQLRFGRLYWVTILTFVPDADDYSGTTLVYPVGADEPPWEIHFDRTVRLAICIHPQFGKIARGDLLDVLAEFDYMIATNEIPPALRPACD